MDELAVGIDPNKVTFFLQSMIPEIAELTVFYSNLVTIARLQRNPTVKTEIAQKKKYIWRECNIWILGYPVSQAADITAFEGTIIPVGEDQLPLIEQAREIVRKFNSIYGETLYEPQALLSKEKRIKGLDGNEKMGKSLGNAIYLSDPEEEINKKVMQAVTDPGRIKRMIQEIQIYVWLHIIIICLAKMKLKNICEECRKGKRGCVACKKKQLIKKYKQRIRTN